MGVYSEDLRTRVVAAVKAGRGSYRELGELSELDKNTIGVWVKLERETGGVSPQKCGRKA
ncbi:MAG: hypothetical protein IVW51_18200 [Thermaceae bacterium]|nr:hypothetical protein [Thermaceae bacterium]